MMHTFGVLMAKELREILRTWRIWVLPLIALGFGVLAPVMAKITPALLESVAGAEQGFVFEMPAPTTLTAYRQWISDLSQSVLIALILTTAGMVSSERKAGTAVLVLTKPVSRSSLIHAKILSNAALLLLSTVAGTVACWLGTTLIFEGGMVLELVQASALWLALAVFMVALMALLSVVVNSTAGAAGLGFAGYIAVAILSQWGPARDNTLAGLVSAGDRVLTGEPVEVLLPVVTALVGAVALALLAAAIFARKEI